MQPIEETMNLTEKNVYKIMKPYDKQVSNQILN